MTQRVLIVGGGLAGASIAWHLSPHTEVEIFEASRRLGSESSRQNAGMLRRLGEDPYERRLAEQSHRFLSAPPEDWKGLRPAEKTGALMLLSQDPHHLEDGVSHLRALDVTIHAPSGLSAFRPLLGKQGFCGAYFLPDEMACFPSDLLEGFQKRPSPKRPPPAPQHPCCSSDRTRWPDCRRGNLYWTGVRRQGRPRSRGMVFRSCWHGWTRAPDHTAQAEPVLYRRASPLPTRPPLDLDR